MSFVLNPETSRMVKVGQKKWRELIKKGMILNSPITTTPTPVLHVAQDETEAKIVKNILSRPDNPIQKKIGMKKNTYPVRRGNKILAFKNRPKQEEIANFAAEAASRTMHKHMEQLSDDLEQAYECGDDDDLEDFEHKLKNLILQEMVSSTIQEKANTNMRIQYEGRKNNVDEYEIDENYDLGDNYTGQDY